MILAMHKREGTKDPFSEGKIMRIIKIAIILGIGGFLFACGQYGDLKSEVRKIDGVTINEFDMRFWPSGMPVCGDPDDPNNEDICYKTYFSNLSPGSKLYGIQTLAGISRPTNVTAEVPMEDPGDLLSVRIFKTADSDEEVATIELVADDVVEAKSEYDITMEKQDEENWHLTNERGMEKSVNVDQGFEDEGINVDTSYGNDSAYCNGAVYKRISWEETEGEFSLYFYGSSCLEFCTKYPDACN